MSAITHLTVCDRQHAAGAAMLAGMDAWWKKKKWHRDRAYIRWECRGRYLVIATLAAGSHVAAYDSDFDVLEAIAPLLPQTGCVDECTLILRVDDELEAGVRALAGLMRERGELQCAAR